MTGAELMSAAGSGENPLNIGTADYFVHKMGDGDKVTLPGQLIAWASGLDGEAMRTKADALAKLEDDGYAGVVSETPLTELDNSWHGQGGDAFVLRWRKLQEYVGRDKDSGQRDVVVAQVAAFRNLAQACDDLQRTLTDSLNGGGLSQVREEYCKALCAEGDESAVASAISGIGLGATIGSPGLWPGVAIGGIVGGVAGLITGLMNDAEAHLKQMAGAEVAVSNVGAQFEGLADTLVLNNNYGDDSKVDLTTKDYQPANPYGRDWDEELGGGWEVGAD